MSKNKKKNTEKEFGLSSWAINNKTTMYVLIAVFFYLGVSAFFSMPRENFPEVNETKIYVSTIYPGNTAEDIRHTTRVHKISGVAGSHMKGVKTMKEVGANTGPGRDMKISVNLMN